MVESKRLFVEDVAARRGVCISAARTWLAGLEAKGSPAVQRHGRRLYTTEAALASLEPRPARQLDLRRLATAERRVREVLQKASAIERLVETISARVARLDAEFPSRRPISA